MISSHFVIKMKLEEDNMRLKETMCPDTNRYIMKDEVQKYSATEQFHTKHLIQGLTATCRMRIG